MQRIKEIGRYPGGASSCLYVALCALTFLPLHSPAQTHRVSRRIVPDSTVNGDVARLKELAEEGHLKSQMALAAQLVQNQYHAQALIWYRRAAQAGELEAKYRVGDMLLFGRTSIVPNEQVTAKPTEGVRWTYEAATNDHPLACRNMSIALQQGLAIGENGTEAYAWLELFARSNAPVAHLDMDRLALKLSLKEIQDAHILAGLFAQGRWPELKRKPLPIESQLRISGVSLGGAPFVIINNKTMGPGESADVPIPGGTIRIKCLRVGINAVEIELEAEAETCIVPYHRTS